MGLGDAIVHSVLRQHDPGDDHQPATVFGAQQRLVIDDLRARRPARNWEQLGSSFWVRHEPRYTLAESKMRTGLVRTLCPSLKWASPLENTKNNLAYVRRPEIDIARGAAIHNINEPPSGA
jgi:hypothetical protein